MSFFSRLVSVRRAVVGGSIMLFSWLPGLTAQTPSHPDGVFYRGYPYGSQALFSPLTAVANKGFDVFQLGTSSRDPWSFPYRNGFGVYLKDVVTNPVAAIERHPGWGPWVRTEILPLSMSGDAGWVVNWTEHFLGGGVTYRSLADWYGLRGFPAPKLFAAATSLGAAALNEVTEFPDHRRASASSVADFWIFDLGSVLFFSWDKPVDWLAGHVRLADWSTQAAITLPNGELQNNGQYFIVKAPLPWERHDAMVRFGLGVQLGLATHLDEERSFTAALGLDTQGRYIDGNGREWINLMFGGGLYYDRNDSLLASLTMSSAANRFALNLYPGFVGGPLQDVGLWAVFPTDQAIRFGVSSRHLLGVGLGYGQDR